MLEQTLNEFIVAASTLGYAAGNQKQWKKEADESTSIFFESGPWNYHDNFFGGEPYGGRSVIFYDSKPVWMMVYYGLVVDSTKTNEIYRFLRNALKHIPPEYPFRGPRTYTEYDYIYTNTWTGNLENFSGEEKISYHEREIYFAKYLGGLVDQQKAI